MVELSGDARWPDVFLHLHPVPRDAIGVALVPIHLVKGPCVRLTPNSATAQREGRIDGHRHPADPRKAEGLPQSFKRNEAKTDHETWADDRNLRERELSGSPNEVWLWNPAVHAAGLHKWK